MFSILSSGNIYAKLKESKVRNRVSVENVFKDENFYFEKDIKRYSYNSKYSRIEISSTIGKELIIHILSSDIPVIGTLGQFLVAESIDSVISKYDKPVTVYIFIILKQKKEGIFRELQLKKNIFSDGVKEKY